VAGSGSGRPSCRSQSISQKADHAAERVMISRLKTAGESAAPNDEPALSYVRVWRFVLVIVVIGSARCGL